MGDQLKDHCYHKSLTIAIEVHQVKEVWTGDGKCFPRMKYTDLVPSYWKFRVEMTVWFSFRFIRHVLILKQYYL